MSRASRVFPAFLAIVAATAALAQQPPPVRVRGTIEQSDGSTLVVKTRAGETLAIKLADNARVSGLIPISRAELKPGARIMVFAAQRQADGTFTTPSITVGRDGLTPPM